MKGKWTVSCLLGLLIYMIACTKGSLPPIGDKIMQFTWEQTQCSDPWVNDPASDSISLRNLNDYLKTAGLTGPLLFATLKPVAAAPVNCTACNCKTGKVFYVSVIESAALKQKYLQAGFRQ